LNVRPGANNAGYNNQQIESMPELVSLSGNKLPSSVSGSSKNKQSGRSGVMIRQENNMQTITLLPGKQSSVDTGPTSSIAQNIRGLDYTNEALTDGDITVTNP
jgi:hypothetical protein